MSISFVLASHALGPSLPRLGNVHLESVIAGLGVRTFFVISGFLITSLLLDETTTTGTVSLRRFYLRRTLRIFPPFYLYVAFIGCAAAAGWLVLERFDLLAASTYTTNYHRARAWYLGHAWSLSVEEQFYLLWPFLLKALGPKRAATVALATVATAPLLRIGLMIAAPSLRLGIGETFPTVADAIATGCLLACWRGHFNEIPRLANWLRGRRFWLIPLVGLGAASIPSAKLSCFIGETITNVAIALLIERVVRAPDTGFGQLLNTRPMVFIGTISYSLYIWQQPFLHEGSTLVLRPVLLGLALVFALALASHYLVERPTLRLRASLERRWFGRPAPAPRAGQRPTKPTTTSDVQQPVMHP